LSAISTATFIADHFVGEGCTPRSVELPDLSWAAAIFAFSQIAKITFDYASSIMNSQAHAERCKQSKRFEAFVLQTIQVDMCLSILPSVASTQYRRRRSLKFSIAIPFLRRNLRSEQMTFASIIFSHSKLLRCRNKTSSPSRKFDLSIECILGFSLGRPRCCLPTITSHHRVTAGC